VVIPNVEPPTHWDKQPIRLVRPSSGGRCVGAAGCRGPPITGMGGLMWWSLATWRHVSILHKILKGMDLRRNLTSSTCQILICEFVDLSGTSRQVQGSLLYLMVLKSYNSTL
jgi:hypothetical protein